MIKTESFLIAALTVFNLAAATPVISSVTAQQRYPWNGKVDIAVTMEGASNDVAGAECVFAAVNSATKTALTSTNVTSVAEIAGSGAGWTRRFVWDASADVGEVRIADVALTVKVKPLDGQDSAHDATTHLALDTRTGTRYARAEEPILFSTDWSDGVTRLTLNIDGTNVLTATTATNGVYVWKPDFSTVRTVTLKHATRGTVNESLTATFTTTACLYADAVHGDDGNDGGSAVTAVKTLTRAYSLAAAGEVILVAAGTYGPVTATGVAVTFRAADGAIIDGGGERRCVTADDDVVFENFTLCNGYDAGDGGGAFGGTFDRCTIRDSVSVWDGGGAYNSTLRNCVLAGNTAENGWGGGAYGGSLSNCVVKGNVAGDAGGGVYEPESLFETTFSGNSPEDTESVGGIVTAGGSFVYVPSEDATVRLIPHDWLVTAGLANPGDSTAGLDAKLAAPYASSGYTGWEAYVAGLTAVDQDFVAKVELVDGEVRVSWTPYLNTNGDVRIYRIYGCTSLSKRNWETPAQPWHRFFKVTVSMPTGAVGEESTAIGEGFVPEDAPLGGVQLWEDGPYWAECNVGATRPEECGYYFWWGDTVGYKRNASSNGWESVESGASFLFNGDACPTYGKSTIALQTDGYIDSVGNLTAEYDAATAYLGAPWRMPTVAETEDLFRNCTTSWTRRNGVYGCLVTGKGAYASKSIFLPAAGCGHSNSLFYSDTCNYWSSTPYSDSAPYLDSYYYAWYFYFAATASGQYQYYDNRGYGRTVRPLRESVK